MSSKTKATATKEEATPALVPKLRFPEFRRAEGWKEKAFGELLDEIIDFRGRTPAKLGMEWGNGNITSLSANNVKNGFIDYKAECNLGSEELYQRWMGDVNLEKGDIVFTMEAPLGNALLLPDSRKYILSQRVVAFKTNSEVENPFIVQLIWSEHFQDAINKLATGSTAKGINQKALKIVEVKIPRPKEQQKIAECLSSVDELITAQGRKVDVLKTHKKGLMQQLFPQEGETQPRLRFPQFLKGPKWSLKKIGSMLIETTRPTDLEDETVYRLVTVRRRYGGLISRGDLKGNQIKVKSQFLVKTGDFLISKRQIVHNACGLVPDELDGSVVSNEYSVLTPRTGCSVEFFNWFAKQPCVSASFLQCSVGIVIEKMLFKLNAWLKKEFLFPCLEEQQRIADCLTSLDDLITAETQKLEALKTHKKGLMQQLFPSPEEVEA